MPRPVPPPPPQPSAEETVNAVRLVRWLSLVALLLFAAWAWTYSNGATMVAYGRDNGASWNLRKARLLDEKALQRQRGQKIVWLVGSSILRESFNEGNINRALQIADIPWRVRKFGQTRGAAGLSSGMLTHLPIEAGDLVVHNVAVENFRRDWVGFTDLPDWRLLLLMDDADIWAIDEWSTSQKLETLVAWPRNFFRYHEEAMKGWIRWLEVPLGEKVPRKRRKSMHTRFKSVEEHKKLELVRDKGLASKNTLEAEDLDLSPQQFNMQGIDRMRTMCQELGVDLVLVDVPQRQEYRDLYLEPEVQARWAAWMTEQPDLLHFPQLPDGDYYDMKHPNFRGRSQLSVLLVQWLMDRHQALETNVLNEGHPGAPE